MSERVIALDPGERTGFAYGVMDVDRLELQGTGVLAQLKMAETLAAWQMAMPPGVPGSVAKAAAELRRFDVIVAESWRPRRKNGSMDWIEGDRLLSAQHVGQIRLIAHLSGARYVELAPSDKPAWVRSMPQAWADLDSRSNEQHDKDARMHLWGYFFREWFTGTKEPELILP